MTEINKQAFVSELAKFLSFMRDEDKSAVLDMYSSLFDEVVDTEKLLSLLMSPTRQAVLIARAYDADAPAANDSNPKYIKVVEDIRSTALSQGLMDAVKEAPVEEAVDEDGEDEEETDSIPVLENQVSIFDDPEPQPSAPAFVFEPENAEPASEIAPASEDYAADDAVVPVAPAIPTSEDEINAFFADFERNAAAEIAKAAGESSAPETAPFVFADAEVNPQGNYMDVEDINKVEPIYTGAQDIAAETKTVRKARVPLLILYCIAAIPVTLLVLILLLFPAITLFSCAVTASVAGAFTMSAVFSGFAVLADILVVLGCALIIIAVALFFIWAFFWFVACVMIGWIKAVIALGRKWCYKEVPVA